MAYNHEMKVDKPSLTSPKSLISDYEYILRQKMHPEMGGEFPIKSIK